VVVLEMGLSEVFVLAGLELDLLILASQVARITRLSHLCPRLTVIPLPEICHKEIILNI
jgi:hypothetical protein